MKNHFQIRRAIRDSRHKSRAYHSRIVSSVNRRVWWHTAPRSTSAYKTRGTFFASSFKEAAFWGRPLHDPFRVSIACPLVGDERTIETLLFGRRVSDDNITLEERWKLDARMKRAALTLGYDSIVLISPRSFSKLKANGKVPRSIELNILDRSRVRTH
jgi:hypothetical protein